MRLTYFVDVGMNPPPLVTVDDQDYVDGFGLAASDTPPLDGAHTPRADVTSNHGDDADDCTSVPAMDEGFVVSIHARCQTRRLHFVGRCWRLVGVHYQKYAVYDDRMP
jgi:hypothetical protein